MEQNKHTVKELLSEIPFIKVAECPLPYCVVFVDTCTCGKNTKECSEMIKTKLKVLVNSRDEEQKLQWYRFNLISK